MDYLKNTSFLYIPFSYDIKFEKIQALARDNRYIEVINDHMKYMFKYITEKNDQLCVHVKVKDEMYNELDVHKNTFYYLLEQHEYQDQRIQFGFQILDIDLYFFSTSVGIAVYRLNYENNDPLYISTAQYYMKKLSREMIDFVSVKKTTLEIIKEMMHSIFLQVHFDYFFYANEGRERANFLTILDMDCPEHLDNYSFRKELYYLRSCYKDGYTYVDSIDAWENETYRSDENIFWGISNEDVICLTIKDNDHKNFILNTFYPNFNTQYAYMYLLLLHQKYVLYHFLTIIGIGNQNSLEMLEKYHDDFYEFEADFVFSKITEVVQYQQLYDRIYKVFAISDMYEDVREPIHELGERKRKEQERQLQEQNQNTESLLYYIALLGIASALVDSYDFIGEFFVSHHFNFVWFLQLIVVISIVGVLIYYLIIKRRKKD